MFIVKYLSLKFVLLLFTGIQEPRKPVQGKALPSARSISTAMFRENDSADSRKTLSLVQWTEFIEHDLVFTPVMKMGKSYIPGSTFS
jgi:hypothetical protein